MFASSIRCHPSDTELTETCCQLYGRTISLMQCLHSHEDLVILDIGGSLFLWNRDVCYDRDRGLTVINPDSTLEKVSEPVLKDPLGKIVKFYPKQPVG